MLVSEGHTLLEGLGLPRELQSASDLDSSRGPSCSLLPIDYRWQQDAACKSMHKSEFYVSRGRKVIPEVVDACAACPVNDQCLEHALTYEDYGYWAGTNPVQRRSMRRQLRITLKSVSYDAMEHQKEIINQSLTFPSLPATISSDQLDNSFYYHDEMSFEEMLYNE